MSKYLLLYSGTCDPLVITAKNDADLISQVLEDVKNTEEGLGNVLIFELDLARAFDLKVSHHLVRTTRKEIKHGC